MEVGEASENRKPLVLTHHNTSVLCPLYSVARTPDARRWTLNDLPFSAIHLCPPFRQGLRGAKSFLTLLDLELDHRAVFRTQSHMVRSKHK